MLFETHSKAAAPASGPGPGSMPTLHDQPLGPECLRELLFHRHRLRPLQPLQVQHRPGEYLESPLQHTARRPDPRLVLIDKNRGNDS